MARPRSTALLVLAACACAGPAPPRAPSRQVTVEWLYSPEFATVAATPHRFWRSDGIAILLDPGQPAASRTFAAVEPSTGKRWPLVDAAAALQSLKSWLGPRAPSDLPWPDSFAPSGARALYSFDGDVFALDLASSAFRRVTATAQPETAASFSPDGLKIAFVRDHDLWVYDWSAASERRVTQTGSDTILNGTLSWVYWEELFGRQDHAYWWAPDSAAIAYLQTDETPVAVAYFTDFAPAVPRLIQQRYPKAGTANPIVRVGIVELQNATTATTATTWVDLDPAGYEYLARVKWLPDGARLSVQTMTRDHRRLDLWLADRSDGRTAHVLTETDPSWVNVHDDLYFLRDGRRFVWASERDGFAHLYLYRLDGQLVTRLTAGEWSIRSAGGGVFWLRQAVTAIDEAEGWVYFTALRDSSLERHLYRVRLDGTGLARISAEAGTHRVTFRDDGAYYLDQYSNLRTPPALSLHRADGTKIARLAEPCPGPLAAFGMCYPELLSIPASDGFPLPAQVLRPANFDAGTRHPVILHVYAGPSAPTVANAWQHDDLFDQVLLGAGYVVVKVDNRSATAISKRLENTIAGQLGGDGELNDLLAAVRWLEQQSWVDPERLGVWGWSGGGSTTLLLMTRSQEFKAGIAVAPVTDWRYYDTFWAEMAMQRPQDNSRGYEHTSLVRRAANLHGRLLLVHGTHDDNVHPQNAWTFADALIAAGKPFDMMIYPMRKHGISDRAARLHLFQKMVEFWKAHL